MADIARSAIDFRSFEPYYVQLKRILLKDLEADGAEGNLLPSEAGLCAQYSVSRTVVRQALAELEKEGLVLKVKGKGTFVTGRGVDTRLIQETLGFYESLSQAGHVVQSQVLKLATEPCGVDVARLLEVGVGDQVIRFDRVRSLDNRPVQVVRAFMPARLFPGLVNLDMSDRSLYQVLRDSFGVRPATGVRAIEAVALSRPDSDYLGVPKGAPGLRLHSVTRSSDGTVFEHFVAHYRGDSFRFEVEVHSR
ncbi:MAG: GntR family transcriptional regulator [Acidimicrobiales bacterium]|jgi:GntR family transcriptional regulator